MSSKLFDELRREVMETQVLVFAGGLARRMGFIDKPKALLEVAGKPLIDWCIEYYADCGFKDFVLLLGKGHEQIEKYVGKGERYGVNIKYSVDPRIKEVGKGKALKHAILKGIVDKKRRALVCFPDDFFLDRSLPLRFLLHHIEGVKSKGIIVSTVFVWGMEYPYGVGEIDGNNLVRRFVEKPVVNYYTSTGLYMFEPQVFDIVLEKIDMKASRRIEFEEEILPLLAQQNKLYALVIPRGTWIPINTLKDLDRANSILANFLSALRDRGST